MRHLAAQQDRAWRKVGHELTVARNFGWLDDS